LAPNQVEDLNERTVNTRKKGSCLKRTEVTALVRGVPGAKCCHFGGNKNIFLTTAWKKCRRHRIRTCLAASRLFPGAGGGRGGVARQRLL